MLLVAPIEAEDPHRPAERWTPLARSDPGGRSTNDSPSAAATPGILAILAWSCSSVSCAGAFAGVGTTSSRLEIVPRSSSAPTSGTARVARAT